MAVFICKMCGGELEIGTGNGICECKYCQTKQTVPGYEGDQSVNIINRANNYRRKCEFDKAMEIYEDVLKNRGNDPDIYWSIVLCRYGIEYVNDPTTERKVPTCHRMQYAPISEDVDYLEAINCSDEEQKAILKEQAAEIQILQKKIYEISSKEAPFDVFICYKESDGQTRTQDSVLAQDIYYQLCKEGLKVFFSRITLEGKLGTMYEPYIFAALNSAKIMVVIGTKAEYLESVWVKNEWNRFLLLMKENNNKVIIPAYRDMNAYDLPSALSTFQALDMSKLGFMQDLIHGIKKFLVKQAL